MVIGLVLNEIDWGVDTVVVLVMAMVFGTLIFAACFVAAAALQFFLINGAELTNTFTYGGSYACVAAGVDLPDAVEDRVRLPRPGGVHGVPADSVDPRPAGSAAAARLAGVAAPGGGTRGRGRLRSVLWRLGLPALPRRRRMTAPIIELDRADPRVRRTPQGRTGGCASGTTISAVDAMSWSVEPGESVGYIGANGAGKSTTIKMLSGILVPTSGSVRTCGLEPVTQRRELARRIGVVFGQRSQLWWDLPLRESFTILAAIHQLDPAR